jgi:hypothetical protein
MLPHSIAKAEYENEYWPRTYEHSWILSYYITQMTYAGEHPETTQNATFNAIGGIGRIGYRYMPREEDSIGRQFIIDRAGFDTKDKRHQYSSAEVHAIQSFYRWDIHMNFSGGVFVRSLPEIIGDVSSNYDVKFIESVGPHIGFEMLVPYKIPWGFQWNARTYYNAFAKSTPNGESVTPSFSYQLGFLLSYLYKKDTMIYGGYAYRADRISYAAKVGGDSYAEAGDENKIKISGHFLNMILELKF